MSDSKDEKPKKKNKSLRCRCMITIKEATQRGFDVSSDAQGLLRCENKATSPLNKPRFCETDKDCPLILVWTKDGAYDNNKKIEKKEKGRKRRKRRKRRKGGKVSFVFS